MSKLVKFTLQECVRCRTFAFRSLSGKARGIRGTPLTGRINTSVPLFRRWEYFSYACYIAANAEKVGGRFAEFAHCPAALFFLLPLVFLEKAIKKKMENPQNDKFSNDNDDNDGI